VIVICWLDDMSTRLPIIELNYLSISPEPFKNRLS
jgi:hypothetical protein